MDPQAKACVACDRPFTPSATGRPGPTPAGGMSGAAVDQELLPEEVFTYYERPGQADSCI